MAHQTAVVLLLILATAATALANVMNPPSAAVYDKIVKDFQKDSNCPLAWVYFGGRCFKYQATALDWAPAEEYCMNLGAHLVSIHSENEYQLVKALIRAHDPQENPTWIGLSGCQKRNHFFWSDGTEFNYKKWNPGEPNFLYGECCVHINYSGNKNWNDIPCNHNYPFVCANSIN